MNSISLKYTDKRDKAYGIAGMAITLVACDGEHLLAEIDFDDADGSNMHMSNLFNGASNPRMSAKVLWTQTVKDLRAMTSMALGNVACRRRMLSSGPIEPEALDILRELVREQAESYCSLDADEADTLFDNCHSYVRRLFDHSGVQGIASRFSDRILERRNMSANEVVEYLASLGMR